MPQPTQEEIQKAIDVFKAIEGKEPEESKEETPKKSTKEEELEKKVLDLQTQNKKKDSFFSKLFKMTKEEAKEEPEEEEPAKSNMSKQEIEKMEKLEQTIHVMQMDRFMDDLEIPRNKKARNMFLALMSQKERELGKELNDEELASVASDIKEFTGMKDKKETKKEEKQEKVKKESEIPTIKLAKIRALEHALRVAKGEPEPEEGKGTGKRMEGNNKVNNLDEMPDVKAFENMGEGQRALLQDRNPQLYKTLNDKSLHKDHWEVYKEGIPYFGKMI